MLFDWGRFAAEVDEDPVAPDGTTHAYQAERLLVQGALGIAFRSPVEEWRPDQLSIQPVAPGMIGADELFLPPASLPQHHHSPVATDIVERPDLSVVAPYQDDGKAGHDDRHGIARLRNLRFESGRHPHPAQILVLLEPEELLVGIGSGRQAPGSLDGSADRRHGLLPDDAGRGLVHCDERLIPLVPASQDAVPAASAKSFAMVPVLLLFQELTRRMAAIRCPTY